LYLKVLIELENNNTAENDFMKKKASSKPGDQIISSPESESILITSNRQTPTVLSPKALDLKVSLSN
jgi:hypothetical protein